MPEEHELIDQTVVTDNKPPTLPIDEKDNVTFRWVDHELLVDADHFNSNGQAELTFWRDNTDYKQLLLPPTTVNLLSSSNRASVIKQLQNSDDGLRYLPWQWILTCIGYKVTKNARQGEPILPVGKKPVTMKVEYQLSPILEKNQPTTIYSPGGYAKSYLAAYIACLVQFNCRGLSNWTPAAGNVLYLDWESSSQDHERRAWAIKQGLGITTEETFQYRFCHQALTMDIQSIQKLIGEYEISLLIIDSQMAAAGYGPDASQVSTQFYNALRSLRCTTLTLDHVSKAEWGKMADDDSLGPYGSVVKFNRSRSQFEIKRSQSPGEDFMELALIHRKHNEGKLLKPIGIRIDFSNNSDGELEKVTFKACEISDNPELSKVQTLKDRLTDILAGGSMPSKELADQLEKSEGTIRATLNRHKGTFVRIGEEWGLRAYES